MTHNLFDTVIPKVKQYMSETGKAYSVKEIAEYLEITPSSALGVLDLMIAFGIVQKENRRRNYYFLKDTYSDEQINAMLPPKKVPRVHKPRRPRGRPVKLKHSKSFLDEYLADLEERVSQGDGLPALAILDLPQPSDTMKTEPKPPVEMVLALMEEPSNLLIKSRSFATVKHLPKDVRRLSPTETRYLKNLLKHLGGYEVMNNLNTVFAKFSAIKSGRYGDVFYFSMGSNSWDNVLKVTVDSSISDCMMLPTIEADRWLHWNDFLIDINTTKIIRGQYDEMIDKFMESGHKLVEITLDKPNTAYVKLVLKNKIKKRELVDLIEVSRVDKWIYLEKVD